MKPTIRYRSELWKLLDQSCAAVEVGVAEGNFSEDMLRWNYPDGSPVLTKLYMVDRWLTVPKARGDSANPPSWHSGNHKRVMKRMEQFGDRGIILRGESIDMAQKVPDESLKLVYIDGDHSFDGVTKDIHSWIRKLDWGGYMAFHDYENPDYGVGEAVREFCKDRFEIISLPEDRLWDAGAYFQLSV